MTEDQQKDTENRLRDALKWVSAQGSGRPRGMPNDVWPTDLRQSSQALVVAIKSGAIKATDALSESDLDDYDFETEDEPTSRSQRLGRFNSEDDHLEALRWFAALDTLKKRPKHWRPGHMSPYQRVVLARLSDPQPSWTWIARTFGSESRRPPSAATIRRWYDDAISFCNTQRLRAEREAQRAKVVA